MFYFSTNCIKQVIPPCHLICHVLAKFNAVLKTQKYKKKKINEIKIQYLRALFSSYKSKKNEQI